MWCSLVWPQAGLHSWSFSSAKASWRLIGLSWCELVAGSLFKLRCLGQGLVYNPCGWNLPDLRCGWKIDAQGRSERVGSCLQGAVLLRRCSRRWEFPRRGSVFRCGCVWPSSRCLGIAPIACAKHVRQEGGDLISHTVWYALNSLNGLLCSV